MFIGMFIFLVCSTIGLIIKEMTQCYHNGKKHFKSPENCYEAIQISGTILYLVSLTLHLHAFAQHISAISVFGGWMILTLQIGRFPKVGRYVYSVTYVVDIFVWFCLVYFTILLAFAFAFCLLMPNHEIFENPLAAIVKVVAMMTGKLV